MRRGFQAVFMIILFLSLIACNSNTQTDQKTSSFSSLPGTWYQEGSHDAAFTLYDDGTCEIAGEYGYGTWAVVNENQLKITNYYGETDVATISESTDDRLVLSNGNYTQVFLNKGSSLESNSNAQISTEVDIQEPEVDAPVSVQLTRGSAFSDGVAWIEYVDQTGSEEIGLINTNGEITAIKVDDIRNFGSSFSGGYAYINYEDKSNSSETLKQFLIIDSLGNITGRSPTDGNYEILTGGDGVFLVQQTVQSMTANEVRIGVTDKDGKWIYEPAVQSMLSLSSAAQDEYERGEVHYLYHGAHIFSAYYKSDFDYFHSNYLCIYNADTGATAEYEGMKLSCSGYSDAYIPYSFSDGKAITVSDNTIFCIHLDLSITPILVDRPDGDVYFQNGIIFTGEKHYAGNGPSPYIVNGKFYDIDGTVRGDLSQYTLILEQAYDLYRYENGYAAILIYGEDYGWYLSIINTDGQFVFDPVKVQTYSNQDNIGTFSCGVITTQISENIDGNTFSKDIILTTDGEKIEVEVGYGMIGTLVFSDGFAWYDEGKQYIGITGNIMNPVLHHTDN